MPENDRASSAARRRRRLKAAVNIGIFGAAVGYAPVLHAVGVPEGVIAVGTAGVLPLLIEAFRRNNRSNRNKDTDPEVESPARGTGPEAEPPAHETERPHRRPPSAPSVDGNPPPAEVTTGGTSGPAQ